MKKFFEFLGGRKMFFALILVLVVTVFLFTNRSDFEQWSNFCIWVFGSYAVGNGVAHIGQGLTK